MPTEVFYAANLRDGQLRAYRVERLDDDEQHYRHSIDMLDKKTGAVISSTWIDLPYRLEETRRERIEEDLKAHPPRKKIYP